MKTTTRALALAVVAALLAAPGLAGCGKGSAGATMLRLGYFPNITHAPALIGVREEIFQRHLGATRLTTTTFNAGPAAIEALFSGAVDATYVGPNPAINGWARSGGQGLRIVAGTTSGGAGLVVRPGIATPEDLRGRRIATPQLGNTQDVALRYWLRAQGLSSDQSGGGDVSVLPTPNAEIVTGFASGALDGAWVPEPYLSRLVLEHGAQVLVDERTLWPDGWFVTTQLVVSRRFLDRNPTLVSNLLKGHLEAVKRAAAGTVEAKRSANDHLAALTGKGLPSNVVDAAWANLKFTVDPVATSLHACAEHAQGIGLLKPVDLRGIYALEPLNALLRQAGEPEVSAGGLAS